MAVTIHEVAKAARVSVSTVSRAFGSPDVVNAETRRRVLAAAERLRYRPNRAARGLITGRTGNIGVIVPDLENPFFHGVLKGVQSRSREADQWVFLADSGEDPYAEHELVMQLSKQVDGILLCSSRMRTAQLEQAAAERPLVFLNRKVPGSPSVLMDSAGGGRQIVGHLAELGHRRFAYLGGPRTSWSNRERRRGLRTAAARKGLEIVELGPYAPRFEAGGAAADAALEQGVTVIVAYNDLMALGVLARLAERGVAVPGECSVVGFDDVPISTMTTPTLTTVALPKAEAGRAAVDALLGLLEDPDGRPGREDLATRLVVRASTGAPRAGTRKRARMKRALELTSESELGGAPAPGSGRA
ncbi:MAG TPA: LacI family DNA-binding transcriptional regulator [Streptosporangiales bacterium]